MLERLRIIAPLGVSAADWRYKRTNLNFGGAKMKKKVLSVFLVLVMLLCLVPVTALATDTWTEVSTEEALLSALENGGNIRLKNDINYNSELGSATINISGTVNLDLNGNKAELNCRHFFISGSLTVSDNKGNGNLIFWGKPRIDIVTGGSLTLNSGTLKTPWSSVTICNAGTFTMNGGLLKGYLRNNNPGLFYMNGGEIDAGSAPAIDNYGSTIYAGGGTVSSTAENGVACFSGGSISGAGTEKTTFNCKVQIYFGGTVADGIFNHKVTVYADSGYGAGQITGGTYNDEVENLGIITGGTFNGPVINASSYVDGYGKTVECQSIITGGTFKESVTNNGTITGGTFNKEVENNGTISGGTFNGAITEIGSIYSGTFYSSIKEGMLYAKEGSFDDIVFKGDGKIDGHTVTYNVDGKDYAKLVLQNNDNARKPIDPTKNGYIFGGWYTDPECSKAFDFENTTVSEDTTLYGKMIECDHQGNTNALSCTEDTVCSVCSGTIKAAHFLSWKADATHYWQECIREGCDYTTVNNKKEIPTLEIKGKDKVHTDQDYSFSFELPEDSTVVSVEYTIPLMGSFNLKVNAENGIYTGVVSKDNYAGAESFKIIVTVEINDGYTVEVTKNVMLTDEHEGGTATCNEKAICKVCLEPYGEKNPNNHANLKQFPAKTATAAEEGNKEYWYCDGCQKYFSDENAENEIKLKDIVITKLAPSIIKGDGQTVTVGEKKTLEFTSDAAFEDFISVEVDGKTIDESNYTVKSGSTVVTLNADYVANLSAGEHTLGIVSQSGTATAKFTVNEKVEETTTTTDKPTTNDETKSPQTGDNSDIFLWLALLVVSGGAVIATTIASKKRKYNR